MFTESYIQVVQARSNEGITKEQSSARNKPLQPNASFVKSDAMLSIPPVSFPLQSLKNANALNIALFLYWKSLSLLYSISKCPKGI